MNPAAFYSGTSNVVSPLKQSEFPPEFAGATRLTYYASLFRSVEVNATFYKLPKAATVEKWAQSVPDDFRFTFKVPKGVTHAKELRFSSAEVELFVETVNQVGPKKGCLLVQLPPKATREKEEELTALLECLSETAAGWKIAVEFRHPSWYDSGVYRQLKAYGIGMVNQDMPKAPTPRIELSESFVYLRFHGPDGTYRGSYEEDVLDGYAQRISAWLRNGKEVYAYFNNTMGAALSNLQTLNHLVSS
ncbi:MAG TPA: DUF72 domain-containing protein [Flavisolibacter sp.]|jgi:uncharacterized protein YecE (DUF72 family)|nr:DUF72 domain-containing protein [Flavisolibacter sp.]